MAEPSVQLERFNKQAPEHTWQYFRFQGRIIDVQEDEDVQVQDEVYEVEASSSSDSEMSSSSLSDSSVSEHQKRDKRQMETVIADEVTGALHRNTGEAHFFAPAFSYVLRSKKGALLLFCSNFHLG